MQLAGVLFFIHLESRKVEVAGMTPHSNERWMKQIARNVTMEEWGFLEGCRYLIHDRDRKYCQSFRDIIESGDVKTLPLPARSPNLNAFSERWVKSVKDDCLSNIMPNGIIRVKATYCNSQLPGKQRIVFTDQSVVKNAWVGY